MGNYFPHLHFPIVIQKNVNLDSRTADLDRAAELDISPTPIGVRKFFSVRQKEGAGAGGDH